MTAGTIIGITILIITILISLIILYVLKLHISSKIIKDLQYAISSNSNSVSRIHNNTDHIEINGNRYRFVYFPEAAPHKHLFILDHDSPNICVKNWLIESAEHTIEDIIIEYYGTIHKRGAYII